MFTPEQPQSWKKYCKQSWLTSLGNGVRYQKKNSAYYWKYSILARQNVPLRGDRDYGSFLETGPESVVNKGNFEF